MVGAYSEFRKGTKRRSDDSVETLTIPEVFNSTFDAEVILKIFWFNFNRNEVFRRKKS